MTLKTVSCIEVHCDGEGCEETYDDDGGPIHFPEDPELARQGAAGGDWWSDGVIDLCNWCVYEAHEFVFGKDWPGDGMCRRCGGPLSEHPPTEVPAGVLPGQEPLPIEAMP